MTLSEAEKRFGLSKKILEQYAASGFISRSGELNGEPQYKDEDFAKLGLIKTLTSAGFTKPEINRYLRLMNIAGTEEEKIDLLRKQRRVLLQDIHKKMEALHQKQQLLDELDFMVWSLKESLTNRQQNKSAKPPIKRKRRPSNGIKN